MRRQCVQSAQSVVVQVSSIAVTSKDGDLNLGLLGSLADQAHAASQHGKKVQMVFSGPESSSTKAADAVTALLRLKAPQASVSCSVSGSDEQVALSTAQAAGAPLLVYLSHVPGVPSTHSTAKGGALATYVPPPEGHTGHTCQPGEAVTAAAWAAAAQAGVSVVVAPAHDRDVLARVLAGDEVGTLFNTEAAAAAAHAASGDAANGHHAAAAAPAVRDMAVRARAASRKLAALPTSDRVAMLHRVADALEAAQDDILAENAKDVQEATGRISDSLLQRLVLKPAKISQLAAGIRAIAQQEEPIGQLLKRTEIAEGLVLEKTTVPIGVLLIIFEARPDALPQIASLALRSGNGLLLKGGKEAARSNAILHRTIVQAIGPLGSDLISLVTTREEINDLLVLDDVIDLVIPRGGNALVTYIQRNTRIPVLGHADGICHVYVDEAADLDKAIKIVVDSKVDYPAACNAVETVLVHSSWASTPGPNGAQSSGLHAIQAALEQAGVTVHGGARSTGMLGLPPAPAAHHEYSSMDVTLEVVDNQEQALDHIHTNGSGHTECIVTEDRAAAEAFLARVDAACAFHNASTRFADGFRFGLGAEVGISTSRIHARGPVGVEGLMTTKWVMRGAGQLVAKDKGVAYTHKPLPL